ncbi:MAG: outer membrane protein assembly factor BamE [Steroidobacteraceae bacterium]
MHPTRMATRLALVSVLLLAGGCLYRMPVQQGNVLNPEQVNQLESGMTRSQVMFLLGTPMVPNGFNTDRWDYYYHVDAGRRYKPETKRLTVWFKDDKVDHMEGDAAPKAGTTPAAPAPAAGGAG